MYFLNDKTEIQFNDVKDMKFIFKLLIEYIHRNVEFPPEICSLSYFMLFT